MAKNLFLAVVLLLTHTVYTQNQNFIINYSIYGFSANEMKVFPISMNNLLQKIEEMTLYNYRTE